MRRLMLGASAAALVLALGACAQQGQPEAVTPQFVVGGPEFELAKAMTVTHSTFFEPRVQKSADVASVDATSGVAELSYTLTVENVQTEDRYSATIDSVVVKNTGAGDALVDVRDQLFCIGASDPLAEVFYEHAVTIASGAQASFGPFGPIDVTDCSGDVSDTVTVYEAGTMTALASHDFAPTDENAVSGVVGGVLVDEETLPAGYSVTGASLTLGGADVAFSGSTGGSTYTITSDGVVAPGSYSLVKQITRDSSLECTAAMVVNVASLEDAGGAQLGDTSQASIDLTCAPPPPLVCTGTVGYWKGHDWPAGFDPEATFYDAANDSGFTWRGILDEPVKGRPYVQLSYQYVAAMLNVRGNIAAAPAEVQEALNWADGYFVSHDIDSKADRSDVSHYAGILEDFNSGALGIPHC